MGVFWLGVLLLLWLKLLSLLEQSLAVREDW